MALVNAFRGILPAMQVPYREDLSIDEVELRRFTGWLAGDLAYDGFYVERDEYNYYFREGFQRGYEDGYYGQNQYGTYRNGKYELLGSILQTIFSFARF